jgi:hypothetical protein
MYWPAPPPAKSNRWLIPAVIIFAVVLVGCLGAGGFGVAHLLNDSTTTAGGTPRRTSPVNPFLPTPATSGPTVDAAPADDGPQASDYPVGDENDLDRVCDGWYYPQSPKFTGKAPHPVIMLVDDSKDSDLLVGHPIFGVPYSSSKAVENAWYVKDAKKAQLVACVRLTGIGSQVRTCKFDDPKPDKLPLKRATYRLELFEIATGKKLLTKTLKGDDQSCPYAVLIGKDRTIYATVSEKSFISTLKPFVQK